MVSVAGDLRILKTPDVSDLLFVLSAPAAAQNRRENRKRLPSSWSTRAFTVGGGAISLGPDRGLNLPSPSSPGAGAGRATASTRRGSERAANSLEHLGDARGGRASVNVCVVCGRVWLVPLVASAVSLL